MYRSQVAVAVLAALAGATACAVDSPLPPADIDLAFVPVDAVWRLSGVEGDGTFGVPVAGGVDVDGDGRGDVVHAAMVAGDGTGAVSIVQGPAAFEPDDDLASPRAALARVVGTQSGETAGSEVWVDDVTGDGLGDVLIARQGFGPEQARAGAGALTIVPGGSDVFARGEMAAGQHASHVTLLGSQLGGRFAIWVRTGDVDGDGIADLVVGADGQSHRDPDELHPGAAYVIAGGPHLAAPGTYDLADPATLVGRVVRIDAPADWAEGHFGATVQAADLDGNGRAEVLVASTLLRAGASLRPAGVPPETVHSSGGIDSGVVHIVWDRALPTTPWPATLDVTAVSATVLRGEPGSARFGEELIGDVDFDADGRPDLFIGDIAGDATGGRPRGGTGHVLFGAAGLDGLDTDLPSLPAAVRYTRIVGEQTEALSSDTAMAADFDGDGATDLVIGSPHASPQGRTRAGQLHVLFGDPDGWPAEIDLAAPPEEVRITTIGGARGRAGNDEGDTLGYSGAAGDVDGDGFPDIIVNEMLGNGRAPGSVDVGNLLVVSGRVVGGR